MAIRIEDEYPTRSTPADTDYPHGSFKNRVSAEDRGTPLEKSWGDDIYGFLQALLVKAGITPSGVPDTALASDYLDALQALAGGMRTKLMDIGDWDMTADATKFVAHGLDPSKIRTIRVLIRNDDTPATVTFESNGGVVQTGGADQAFVYMTNSGGLFATASYNATSYNRGFITIQYVD